MSPGETKQQVCLFYVFLPLSMNSTKPLQCAMFCPILKLQNKPNTIFYHYTSALSKATPTQLKQLSVRAVKKNKAWKMIKRHCGALLWLSVMHREWSEMQKILQMKSIPLTYPIHQFFMVSREPGCFLLPGKKRERKCITEKKEKLCMFEPMKCLYMWGIMNEVDP